MRELDFVLELGKQYIVIPEMESKFDPLASKIELASIQPVESYLVREEVERYLAQPEIIFNEDPIRLLKSNDARFSYFTMRGDDKLYALHKIGKKEVWITLDFNAKPQIVSDIPGEVIEDDDIEMALETYEEGIRSFSDYENRIVSAEEYHRLMITRYGSEGLESSDNM